MRLGIIGAMPEELDLIIASVVNKEIIEHGSRIFVFFLDQFQR